MQIYKTEFIQDYKMTLGKVTKRWKTSFVGVQHWLVCPEKEHAQKGHL